MVSGSRSPPSVSSPFHGERLSRLGLSGSLGSARSSSIAGVRQELELSTADGPWRGKGQSRKAMWRGRKALHREQEAGRTASSSSSGRRQIPSGLHGLCFRCFEEGHRRQDCTNDPLCI
ncbi:hypothetical protein ZWY2020_041191 [Hordeum vulgare]|nr:hypothetical protein ZWY2020_041191 [Hordeum vulgare]